MYVVCTHITNYEGSLVIRMNHIDDIGIDWNHIKKSELVVTKAPRWFHACDETT